MKLKLVAVTSAFILSACGLTKSPVTNTDDPIRSQRLSTSFVADGVKIETDCKWYKPWKEDCEIIAIESTAVTFTNGNSSANMRNALLIAGDKARAQVSHFIREDITSFRVTETIAKNVEKARDVVAKNPENNKTVEMSDKEANEKSSSNRENSNNTARTLTNTVRVNSSAILRGFKIIKQDVIGPQEVLVTIRWDRDSDSVADKLGKRFGSTSHNR
jgi:hypothetical protein